METFLVEIEVTVRDHALCFGSVRSGALAAKVHILQIEVRRAGVVCGFNCVRISLYLFSNLLPTPIYLGKVCITCFSERRPFASSEFQR
jgi:urea transporter